MEIVIENPTQDESTTSSTSPVNPGFVSHPIHLRTYRPAYVCPDGTSPSVEYYGASQSSRPCSRHISPEPDFEVSSQVPTSVRRVDRSGLLEIAELEPQRSTSRSRQLTGAENPGHSGTLTRRIDRSGLLESVPEVPDQGWRSPENKSSISERQLTGAEIVKQEDFHQQLNPAHRQEVASPRSSRSPIDSTCQTLQRKSSTETLNDGKDPYPASVTSGTLPSSVSSPYLRRFPGSSPTLNLERPTPVMISDGGGNCDSDTRTKNRNSLTCVSPSTTKFLPIDALSPRCRQSYVDLTGATYTRSTVTSPLTISRTSLDTTQTNSSETENTKRQQPDCLGRLNPRLRGQSPLTMSVIPDVIEAHGSRSHGRDHENSDKDAPEGERAEAEGCEHTAIESLEETRVSFKTPNKILHNDNIQTLRVIILSEQL